MKWYLRYTYTDPGGAGLGGSTTEEESVQLDAANENEAVERGRTAWAKALEDAEESMLKQDLREPKVVGELLLQ